MTPHLKTLATLLLATSGMAFGQTLDEDSCSNAGLDAIAGSGSWTFDTSLATTGPEGQSEMNCMLTAGNTGVAFDVWFEWTADADGLALIDACTITGLAEFTKIAVWPQTGTCPMDGTSLTCGDFNCGNEGAVTVQVSAGTVYLVQIGHFPLNPSPGDGTVSIAISPPSEPGCVENWSFETSDLTGWDIVDVPGIQFPAEVVPDGAVLFNFPPVTPTEGIFALRSGFFAPAPGTTTISQDLVIGPGLTPITFDYRLGWDYSIGTAPTLPRTIDLVVRPVGGGPALQTTNVFSTGIAAVQNLDTGPLTAMVDISAFIGQTVQVGIELNMPEAGPGPGFVQIDNVSCAAGGPIGTSYCGPAEVNSNGTRGRMSVVGSPVASDNFVTLTASDLPTFAFGFMITSLQQGFVMNPGGSEGNLCLSGSIGRYVGPGQIMNTGASGSFDLTLDTTAIPQPNGFVAIAAGETWNFQTWYRDTSSTGGATSNFTDGLFIPFQ